MGLRGGSRTIGGSDAPNVSLVRNFLHAVAKVAKASVGLICPSEYYKSTGLAPTEVYAKAMQEQPEVRHLLRNAESTTGNKVYLTKNWSHLADKLAGDNWWICGEAAGFADPILAAGMTLAHGSAREMAFALLESDRSPADAAWVKN